MIQRATIKERGGATLHSAPGPDFDPIESLPQPYQAEGEIIEKHQECDQMVPWYRMRFEGFGRSSVVGWLRASEVELLETDPSVRLAATSQRVSHDEPPQTNLNPPRQRGSPEDA